MVQLKHTTGIQNWRLDEMGITNDIEYVDVDIVEKANVRRMIDKTKLQMKYIILNQSFVALSFEQQNGSLYRRCRCIKNVRNYIKLIRNKILSGINK